MANMRDVVKAFPIMKYWKARAEKAEAELITVKNRLWCANISRTAHRNNATQNYEHWEKADAAVADKNLLLWAVVNIFTELPSTRDDMHLFFSFTNQDFSIPIVGGIPQMPKDQAQADELREAIFEAQKEERE